MADGEIKVRCIDTTLKERVLEQMHQMKQEILKADKKGAKDKADTIDMFMFVIEQADDCE